MQRKKLWRKVFFVLGGVIGLWVGLTVLFAWQYIYPVRVPSGPRPDFLRDVTVPGRDHGVVSWATPGVIEGVIEGDEGGEKVVFVLLHGYGGRRDEMVDLGERLADYGEVVIPAMKGQGVSESKGVGFSVGEAEEVIDIAIWVRGQMGDDVKVIPIGISMGGATAWTAVGSRPELFDGVVSDCAFARMDWATSDFMGQESGVRKLISVPVVALARKWSGVDPETIRPMDWAAKWKGHGPALVVHGGKDPMFKMRHPEELARAGGAEIWVVEEAGHAEAAQVDLDGLVARILSLVDGE